MTKYSWIWVLFMTGSTGLLKEVNNNIPIMASSHRLKRIRSFSFILEKVKYVILKVLFGEVVKEVFQKYVKGLIIHLSKLHLIHFLK